MEKSDGDNVVLAVTGGSGAILAKGLAEALLRMGVSLFFVCSRYGRLMWREELGEPLETAVDEWADAGNVITFNPGDLAAPIASGSFPVRATCIVPCSMATAASIATGVGTNLIHRVADVAIKERTPLVIVPRESPLSPIHLRNLLTLSELGITVLPPMPAFYKYPSTVEDVVYDVTQRAIMAMGLRESLPDALQYRPKRFDTERG